MIARTWRGWAAPADADRYDEHYREEVLTSLRGVPGFRGARLLRDDGETETEFVSITFFDDLDAVRRFAGEDYLTAVLADEARRVLSRFDTHVRVYEVAFEV